MSKKHIGIIAVVSVVIVCTTSVGYITYSGVWTDWIAGEWTNQYNFWFYIECDEDLHNVTLYLPVPMIKGEVHSFVTDINNHTTKPLSWVCEYIDTEHGKMLKITADVIPKGYHSIDIKIYHVDHVINTENPVGNEPVLYPRYNDTGVAYKSYIYANYSTSSATECKIHVEMMGGKNRGVLGAIECKGYRETVEVVIKGEPHDWYLVNGNLKN